MGGFGYTGCGTGSWTGGWDWPVIGMGREHASSFAARDLSLPALILTSSAAVPSLSPCRCYFSRDSGRGACGACIRSQQIIDCAVVAGIKWVF